ncbi:MAG TPA: alkaline phosphatase family protein [Solirubrobacteraceae bacterium]|nr:alkaline phosphatase family protein [Solirubrobacteraceae bacterium]
MPFDHLVVVMMENHSFDNLFGDLGRTRTDVDALHFDAAGTPTDHNPGPSGTVPAFAFADTAQSTHVTQSWRATHAQINGGAMDGFVRSSSGAREPMGYYTAAVLPFAYSLASQFTIGDRWFSSMPGPTYPNRRFLLAGTAYGATVTAVDTLLDPPPPHGTIFDALSAHGIHWCDYFTDLPMTSVIPSIILKHPGNHAPISKFLHDCKAGTLPAVSFVDPGIGVLSDIGAPLKSLPGVVRSALEVLGADFARDDPAETQEDPQDMYWGELWAATLVEAVLASKAWNRTLLIYIYDEHGGYYDHVGPPEAILPDGIAPTLAPGDPHGGYDMYGPRVPAVVVSPYSAPGGVTNVVHDHTSVLATIEAKWNLPALTDRDANAATIMDFLDLELAPRTGIQVKLPSQTGPSGPVTPRRAPAGAGGPP